MMEKLAQPGEGGGARPPHFTTSTITDKVVVYAPAERAVALPIFLLYPYMHSVGQIFLLYPYMYSVILCLVETKMFYFYCYGHKKLLRKWQHVRSSVAQNSILRRWRTFRF